MKKLFAMLLLMLFVAMPAVAGEKGKCAGDGEDCLAKMKTKIAHKAWLGIEYETNKQGRWVVEDVYKGSPAQKAGFEQGDVLLAINGVEYSKENKPALKEVYSKLEPGSQAKYVVERQGGKVKIVATLGWVPEEVQAKWINEHMKKNHPDFQMASK
jgi:C-terminal processing protease CtpA/Prc